MDTISVTGSIKKLLPTRSLMGFYLTSWRENKSCSQFENQDMNFKFWSQNYETKNKSKVKYFVGFQFS